MSAEATTSKTPPPPVTLRYIYNRRSPVMSTTAPSRLEQSRSEYDRFYIRLFKAYLSAVVAGNGHYGWP